MIVFLSCSTNKQQQQQSVIFFFIHFYNNVLTTYDTVSTYLVSTMDTIYNVVASCGGVDH